MKERPILFNAPMVRAILEGRKTQTRRIVKPQPDGFWGAPNSDPEVGLNAIVLVEGKARDKWINCPYGKPGDRLWVREGTIVHASIREQLVGYTADGCYASEGWEKRMPSIHMRRAHSRITLEITEVRVQRLQEIGFEDCLAEGIVGSKEWREVKSADLAVMSQKHPGEWDVDQSIDQSWADYCVLAYKGIWESINGAGSWDANPWVWAVSFKVTA